MRWALVVALCVCPSATLAWDSECREYIDTSLEPSAYAALPSGACSKAPGPRTARNRWIGGSDEHRRLLLDAMNLAGLPPSLAGTYRVRVYTSGARVDAGDGTTVETISPDPTLLGVQAAVTRSFSIPELAQLPDFSYSLWDWVGGHETCPLTSDSMNAATCHSFKSHMGPVNANHFLPQAGVFYRYYHQLAMRSAASCQEMQTSLGPAAPRFAHYLRECEVEALSLEAVAQHYLQDAWSSGHMWQRWGSAELSDFPEYTGCPRRSVASLVAMVSGLIHGARGVTQEYLTPYHLDADDAMCAPVDTSLFSAREDDGLLRSLPPPSVRHPISTTPRAMVGDLYADRLADDAYAFQRERMQACSVAGLREVYRATGQTHGALGETSVPYADPTRDECFSARDTNATMYLGMGFNVRLPTGVETMISLGGWLAGGAVPFLTWYQAEGSVPPAVAAWMRLDLARISALGRLQARRRPDDTDLADGAMGSVLGVQPNDRYASRSGGALTEYIDPPMPWTATGAGPRASLLAAYFHRAHAREWCDAFGEGALLRMQQNVADASSEPVRAAACEACAEMVAPHLRVGTSSSSYDATSEPLCYLLSPLHNDYVYQPQNGDDDTLTLARSWCGCGAAPDADAGSADATTDSIAPDAGDPGDAAGMGTDMDAAIGSDMDATADADPDADDPDDVDEAPDDADDAADESIDATASSDDALDVAAGDPDHAAVDASDAPCVFGATRCEAETLYLCNASHVFIVAHACAYPACASPVSCAVCPRGSMICRGNSMLRCSDDGSVEIPLYTCPLGACWSSTACPVCHAGDSLCQDGRYMRCDTTRNEWATVATCASMSCATPYLCAAACAPSSTRCLDGIRWGCNTVGTGESPSRCPTDRCASATACAP